MIDLEKNGCKVNQDQQDVLCQWYTRCIVQWELGLSYLDSLLFQIGVFSLFFSIIEFNLFLVYLCYSMSQLKTLVG